MDWLCANAMSISWDILERINFHPGVDLSDRANTERLVAQDTKLEGGRMNKLILSTLPESDSASSIFHALTAKMARCLNTGRNMMIVLI